MLENSDHLEETLMSLMTITCRSMRRPIVAAALALGVLAAGLGRAQAVEIQYWQYVFDTRVQAMTEVIKQFEAENPGITVKQVTFPYADYQTRLIAAKAAGRSPEVMQLFYGWLDTFIAGKLVQPLSKGAFQDAEIEKDFFPIVSALAWPLRRSNSRTSIRVERPAIGWLIRTLAAMLAQPGTIYYIRILTKDLEAVKLPSEREK